MPTSHLPAARASEEATRLPAAIAQTAGVPFYYSGHWQAAFADR